MALIVLVEAPGIEEVDMCGRDMCRSDDKTVCVGLGERDLGY
jgi:hypothetical protein